MSSSVTGPPSGYRRCVLYCLDHARTDDQREQMRALDEEKICVFCPEGFAALDQPILGRTTHWTITSNPHPYRNAELHLLLVPYAHVNDMLHLSVLAKADFFAALKWARDHYALNVYRTMVRSGACATSGAVVEHLHVHVIVE